MTDFFSGFFVRTYRFITGGDLSPAAVVGFIASLVAFGLIGLIIRRIFKIRQ